MVKKLQTLFLCAVLLVVSSPLEAQVPELIRNEQFRKDAQAAVDSLYNFNPQGADKRLEEWKNKYPHHPLWKLMDGMEFWWIILSDLHDTSRDEMFYKMMKQADYAASKVLYNQPGHADALIIQTVANGYVARQHSNRDEWVTSLNAARKAYSAYGYLQENIPDLPDLKLAEGLKLYYSEYLPEAYPVVKSVSWFLPDGDKQKGLKYLREASQDAIFARAEASYFLGNINYNYEHNYEKASGYFQRLYETYPHNNYYARLLVKNYYQMKQYDKAIAVINESLKRWDKQDLPFKNVLDEELLFWKGRILYHRGKDEEALPLFEKSLALSKDLPRAKHREIFVASAYYAGNIARKNNQTGEAIRYYKTALDGKTGDEYKKRARRELESVQNEP